jgi:cytochrome P450
MISTRPGSCASSLLFLIEAGQQAERALEQLRRDEAGGQALVDLQAGQQRLPDGPGLDGRRPRGESRVVEPAVLRLCQWRGDPVARLMLPATKADPYPLYTQVRQRGLVRSPLGVFAAADHATVSSILRDRRFSSSPVHQRGYRPPSYPPGDPRAGLPAADLLTMDPPDHTRLRRLVAGTFTPRAIAGLEPWIRELTVRLLAAADGSAGFDLIEALAFPLPIAVICYLLGVPAEDQARFRAWGHDVAATLDPQTKATAQAQTRAAELALTGYLQDLVAGFETTVNLIGNGTVALLGDPDSWDRLRQDPALVPAAIEEMLRYDSPVLLARPASLPRRRAGPAGGPHCHRGADPAVPSA